MILPLRLVSNYFPTAGLLLMSIIRGEAILDTEMKNSLRTLKLGLLLSSIIPSEFVHYDVTKIMLDKDTKVRRLRLLPLLRWAMGAC